MPGLPQRKPQSKSLLFRLRLPKVLGELKRVCLEASKQAWDSLEMKRAGEISLALAEALRLEGLRDAGLRAQSLNCLMGLSKDQILPIEEEFLEKVWELLHSLEETVEQVLESSGS